MIITYRNINIIENDKFYLERTFLRRKITLVMSDTVQEL